MMRSLARFALSSLVLPGLLLSSLVAAQSSAPTQEDLAGRLAKKLEAPWLKAAPWILDLAEAKAASKATGKPIFAYFTRSYSP